jgi:hypothetical protein
MECISLATRSLSMNSNFNITPRDVNPFSTCKWTLQAVTRGTRRFLFENLSGKKGTSQIYWGQQLLSSVTYRQTM